MQVTLDHISKRYLYDWIIKDFSHSFATGSRTGVSGINGSGKSTLIKMISGWLSPSTGTITYEDAEGGSVARGDVHGQVSIVGPYTDVIQEYELREMYDFHTKFRSMPSVRDYADFQAVVRLKGHSGKAMQYYSSGMKQRVQLALALLSETSLLLLDEPTSYLDEENKLWFYTLLSEHMAGKTVIISSNDQDDFQHCTQVLSLT